MYGCAHPGMTWLYANENRKVVDRPLDPIARHTVGRFRLQRAMLSAAALGLRILSIILMIVAENSEPEWMKNFQGSLRGAPINMLYAEHVAELITCGLVRRCSRQDVKWVSSYFEVEKGEKARAIFNGKRLSAACPVPPSVNLTTHHRIVQEISKGRFLIVTVDLRHWFHQIPTSLNTQKLFGLRQLANNFLCWVCLPMGWSFSPAIAQASSWMLVLHREKNESELFDTSALRVDGTSLPAWCYSVKGDTAVTIYYDNLVIVSRDRAELNSIVKRIRRNIVHFNAEVKLSKAKSRGQPAPANAAQQASAEKEEWKTEDLRRGEPVEILGMRIVYRAQERHLIVQPRKLTEWSQMRVPEKWTIRTAAEFCGKLVFAAQLREPCLHASSAGRAIVNITSRLGVAAHKHGWDAEWTDDTHRKSLSDLWATVEEWTAHPITVESIQQKQEVQWLVATDASSTGWGVVIYRGSLDAAGGFRIDELVLEQGGAYNSTDTRHIFYKELETALFGMKWLAVNGKQLNAIIVVDNTAVAWVLRHGASKSEQAMRMLENSLIHLANCVEVISVASADNPADPASRHVTYEKEREVRMLNAVSMHHRGVMWASEKKPHSREGVFRHDEPGDGDDVWMPAEEATDDRMHDRADEPRTTKSRPE